MNLEPTGKQYRISIATMWIVEKNILAYRTDKNAVDEKASALEWIDMTKKICKENNLMYPIYHYVDISECNTVNRDSRLIYMNATNNAKAVALMTGSPTARIIGNFMLGINKAKFPIKLFTEDKEALAWLREISAADENAK